MRQTETLVVGASISGLALAACLQNKNVEYIIIEKEAQIAVPWRNHYERLHLHTNKRVSSLPFKKFSGRVPRYPSRLQVIDYLEDYQKEFSIAPIFNTEAKSIKRENNYWITETTNGTFKSNYVVIATGPFGKPLPINFKGMETFPGKILHSCEYKTGRDFKGKKVLVVGFGNSACEIAIDLFEQDAMPSMAVRSAVNIVSRDVLGIPILEISLLLSRLKPRIADTVSSPLTRLLFGDITKLGLQKMPYGPFEQIKRDGKAPVLDIGIIRHIRQGHIKIYGDIDYINGSTVYFKDGRKEDFDAIVAAIGYYRDYAEITDVDTTRFEDLKLPAAKQKSFGKDGLYFCGFWISPTGQIRETSLDAQKIAGNISRISHKGTNY
ncbi:MAG: NAD(P)/FAD-dependent oxidoreductase [Bacteroidota bacterium]|nr:NAD(P)/FAD-dependent oxidoreductase [Bacteroidota bacterium]